MKEMLIDLIICPACLPREEDLTLHSFEQEGGEILDGELRCGICKARYPIKNGIAFLSPRRSEYRPQSLVYENPFTISSYLWSHYGDIFDDPEASCAYAKWAALLEKSAGISFDTGCAAGRMTFEMGCKSDFAIGIDNSTGLIQAARNLMTEGRLEFSQPIEGRLMARRTIECLKTWKPENVEFIVGDALCAPFPSNSFSSIASLNIIDKIDSPISHLKEIDRTAKKSGAHFLFSDPFSWSTEVAKEEDWLGGKVSDPYSGMSFENIISFLDGEYKLFDPPWKIQEKGSVWWKIRKHQNLFELIRSWFIKAYR